MRKRTIFFLLLALCLLFTAAASAQEDDDDVIDCNNPNRRMTYLMEKTDYGCDELVALMGELDIGLGQILKAVVIAEGLEGFDGDWEELLSEYRSDIGWGGVARAFGLASRFADPEITGRVLLDYKNGGLGWGEIRKAHAISEELGIDFHAAVTKIQEGYEWEGDGPPPWANGGNKDKDKETGPPEWANNDKVKDKDNGPPDWANNEKDKSEGETDD